jgi:hypothetical protein
VSLIELELSLSFAWLTTKSKNLARYSKTVMAVALTSAARQMS